jgi:chromosome segregation ATPase
MVASAARRLEEKLAAADRRQEDLLRDMDRVKGEALTETAAAMRAHQGRMDEAERQIAEMKDRNARSAERVEALTDSLGSVGRKLDGGTERLAALAGDVIKLHGKVETEVSGAQLLAERLGTIESWIAKAHDRERARAELHARLADSLLPPA